MFRTRNNLSIGILGSIGRACIIQVLNNGIGLPILFCLLFRRYCSDEKQVKEMVEQAVKKFGKIDILVNNAGIVFDVPFNERTIEQWKRTLEVNLIGTFICSRIVAKFMRKQKSGSIINISSTNGEHTYHPDSIDYSASKAGVINLTKSLAMELGPNIRVNSVAPGWVDTDMNKELPENYLKKELQRIYLKRIAKPEEIAKAVLFLASDDASYVNGITLIVDGGDQR
ncbi:MAG: SDR family NAD(P)-dependent oxidoreductase [Candidatus Pacearchaeota archaeon]|nr:SDR family NAD(P)-dependent oxidoreductase [Candidatus Pacearchaeota archaeon]